jgi:hypothetical protein
MSININLRKNDLRVTKQGFPSNLHYCTNTIHSINQGKGSRLNHLMGILFKTHTHRGKGP